MSGDDAVTSMCQTSEPGTPMERVIAALEWHDCTPRESGGQWKSCCPAHEDQVPSLSIGEGDDGRVLLHCHAGCEPAAIVLALSLSLVDLFVPPTPRASSATGYAIRDSAGRLVATHIRREGAPKRFAWVSPDGSAGLHGLPVKSLPLYGSERVPAYPAGTPIILVEGEKAAAALVAAGFASLGTVTGASGCPAPEVLGVLQGHPVTLWPDCDAVGRRHMERIGRRLLTLGLEVRVFTWAGANEHEDAADYFARGRSSDQLRADLGSAVIAQDWLSEVGALSQPNGGSLGTAEARASGLGGSRAVVTRLADVEAQAVEWLWPGRIPLGMLTIFDGDPGLGKSTVLLDLAARLSHGASMPDGTPGPQAGGSVILTAEDDLARVVRPRLEAAGADLSRIVTASVKEGDGVREPSLTPDDLAVVEAAVCQADARLLIIDPLMAYLPADVNANRDPEVRRTLVHLRDLAERRGAAVVVVRHLNKAKGGPVLYRGGGSIGIIGAARSGLLLAADPAVPNGGRVLAVVKSNLAQKSPSVRLQLVRENGHDFPVVRWGGTCDLTAAQLLAAAEKPERRSARAEAIEFLRNVLAQGRVPAKEVERAAADAGISEKTLRRAGQALGMVAEKAGRPMDAGQQWFWSLPLTPVKQAGPKMATYHDCDHLQGTGGSEPDEIHASSKMVTDAPKVVTGRGDDDLRRDELPLNDHPKVVNRDVDHLRENGAKSEICVEDGQILANGRLRLPHSSGLADGYADACASCGARTLQWGSATICAVCHRRAPGRSVQNRDALRA